MTQSDRSAHSNLRGRSGSTERPHAHISFSSQSVDAALESMACHDKLTVDCSVKLYEAEDESRPSSPPVQSADKPTDKTGQSKPTGCMDSIIGCLCGLLHKKTNAEAYVWKLAHDNIDHTKTLSEGKESDLRDLMFWRRRRMFLHDTVRETLVAYISEKDEGSLLLTCITSSKGVHAEMKPLPRLDFQDISEDTRQKVARTLQQHHIAFAKAKRLYTEDEFYDYVPTMLFPAEIRWQDRLGNVHVTVLGWEEEKYRHRWLEVMGKKKC